MGFGCPVGVHRLQGYGVPLVPLPWFRSPLAPQLVQHTLDCIVIYEHTLFLYALPLFMQLN